MKNNKKIHLISNCGIFAAIICLIAPFTVPIGPVPITLSLFAVFLTANCLNSLGAIASVAVYILIGVCGLPVFSGANAGVGVLVGYTGGYIWGYLAVAAILPLILKLNKVNGNKVLKTIFDVILNIIPLMILYLIGTLQFSYISGNNFLSSLVICVLPFIGLDIVKIIAAVIIGYKIKKVI